MLGGLRFFRYPRCRTSDPADIQYCAERYLGEASRMDDAEIYERLTEIFHSVFDDDSIELTPQLSAKDVDGWDSLSHIRLLLTIEKSFRIKLSTSEIGKLKDVGDLVALIRSRA
jgi:acyl carrier protein